MLRWFLDGLRDLLTNKEELIEIMAALDDLRTATAAVSAQVTQLATDVDVKLAADAAALAAASANTVTDADVAAVAALGTQVAAVDAKVNG